MPESITDFATTAEEGSIVIHNAEQQAIIATLSALVDDTNAMLRLAASQSEENETLYKQVSDWSELACDVAERWIDVHGNLGWRVYIIHANPLAARLFAFISGKLGEAGWDNVLVVAA
jgi:hypothetical protein